MFVRISTVMGLILFSGALTAASNTPQCYEFFSQPEKASPVELLQIADSCPVEELSELYQNRAAHVQLLNESLTLATQFQPRDDFDRHMESYRIYIALIESFSVHFKGSLAELITELNNGYQNAMELARLRLKGYEKRAEWLEWYKALKKN
ncbi:MAG TPA: hypothetical protein DD827_08315 [Gammaproteobacteria bacterium]|nr:hypothetical protein [Gammaproteobacteria bacterium]